MDTQKLRAKCFYQYSKVQLCCALPNFQPLVFDLKYHIPSMSFKVPSNCAYTWKRQFWWLHVGIGPYQLSWMILWGQVQSGRFSLRSHLDRRDYWSTGICVDYQHWCTHRNQSRNQGFRFVLVVFLLECWFVFANQTQHFHRTRKADSWMLASSYDPLKFFSRMIHKHSYWSSLQYSE